MPKSDPKAYSFWVLMEKLYAAKRTYYGTGKSDLTDQEFDALESSIKVIHGEDRYKEWYRVGYCAETHAEVKANAQEQMALLREEYNEKD